MKRSIQGWLCLLCLLVVTACGGSSGGGNTSPVAVAPQPSNPGSVPTQQVVVSGVISDPYEECQTTPTPAFCQVNNSLLFPAGSGVELRALSDRGQLTASILATAQVAAGSEFSLSYSSTNTGGLSVQVSSPAGELRGYVLDATADISVWSEALYQFLIAQPNLNFSNLVSNELQDMLNALQTSVPFPEQASGVTSAVQQVGKTGQSTLTALLACYQDAGDQTAGSCRQAVPIAVTSTRRPRKYASTVRNNATLGLRGGSPTANSNTVVLQVRRSL